MKKIEQFKRDGKTIIYISHDLESVKKICDRTIWLDKGAVIRDGVPEEVVGGYLSSCRISDKTP